MEADFTTEIFRAYLTQPGSEGNGSGFSLSKSGALDELKLQFDTNPPSQKTLDECLLIGLGSLSSSWNQHSSLAALELLLQFGAKWDGSTSLDIICPSDKSTTVQQCPRPRYRGTNSFLISIHKNNTVRYNPCLLAISMDMLDVVQLLEKYEQQTFQSLEALICAVHRDSLKIVNYLLSKYKYSLNMEYIECFDPHTIHKTWNWTQTIITEACKPDQLEMVTLLMEHGADPAKKSDDKRYQSALMIAIKDQCNELVEHFIRSGVNFDCRLHDLHLGDVLPFEYAVFVSNKQAAEMLLNAGCSCGAFSLVNSDIGPYGSVINRVLNCVFNVSIFVLPDMEKLMIEWDVYKNKVKPLQQLCRKSILKDLYPRAVRNIIELPLPPIMISYLSIPGKMLMS